MAFFYDLNVSGSATIPGDSFFLGIYANSLVTDTLNGSIRNATYATNDYSGNNIASTYLKKADSVTSLSSSGGTLTFRYGDGLTSGTASFPDVTVVNNLTTTNTSYALSAYQGNILSNYKWGVGSRDIALTSGSTSTTTAYMLCNGTATVSNGYVMLDNLVPYSNGSYSVGTSGDVFKHMYATTFHGALDGNATTATGTSRDSSGYTINTSYVKKTDGITGLSLSGSTLTYTKGDGTSDTITLPTLTPTLTAYTTTGLHSDESNTQTSVNTSSGAYYYDYYNKKNSFKLDDTYSSSVEFRLPARPSFVYKIGGFIAKDFYIRLGVFDLDYDFSSVLYVAINNPTTKETAFDPFISVSDQGKILYRRADRTTAGVAWCSWTANPCFANLIVNSSYNLAKSGGNYWYTVDPRQITRSSLVTISFRPILTAVWTYTSSGFSKVNCYLSHSCGDDATSVDIMGVTSFMNPTQPGIACLDIGNVNPSTATSHNMCVLPGKMGIFAASSSRAVAVPYYGIAASYIPNSTSNLDKWIGYTSATGLYYSSSSTGTISDGGSIAYNLISTPADKYINGYFIGSGLASTRDSCIYSDSAVSGNIVITQLSGNAGFIQPGSKSLTLTRASSTNDYSPSTHNFSNASVPWIVSSDSSYYTGVNGKGPGENHNIAKLYQDKATASST